MLGVMKVLLPLGVGLAGLVAFAGKSQAKSATQPRDVPTPRTPGLTTTQVAEKMAAAIASADPKILNKLADELQAAGFPQQAADLRGVAAELAKVGAAAAGAAPPATPVSTPTKPVTPPAAIPAPTPTAEVLPIPPLKPPVASPGIPPIAQTPTIVLPEQTIFAPAPSKPSPAAQKLAQNVVLDQMAKPKWKDDRNLVSTFQTQESALGHYVNILTGAPGKVDGLYGPGTALAIAKFYGIVPPNPKYWPTNPAPSVTKYRAELLKLAAEDPARAEDWTQAAQKAKAV